ncbi:MAG: Rne/Rng family ribonuclease, partial [Gaiellales bacterium]
MLVSVGVGQQEVAILEDGKPVEVYLERRGRRSIAGNVYKGVVDNVLPGMEASFVDIGLAKNGFLYVDEIVVEDPRGIGKSRPVLRQKSKPIQDLVSRGQEILVQAVKDPMGTKGARLTTEISLPGRFLVYVPYGEGLGVSKRLEDAERERLKALCRELDSPDGGIIVRTAAEGATEEELTGDLALLRKLWATILGRSERAEPPTLVYQESELPLRVVRDLFTRDYERLLVDHERTHRRITGYLRRTSKELAARVELCEAKTPLMEQHGVGEAVRSTLNRRVDLPSGGYLIFDYAEALTVIDVNTGRFVGSRGKGSGARLEDTITQNNLEAAVEIVRQLRLRDIGGIIVIDFIDMTNLKNRKAVEEALAAELGRDRTKTYVVEISPLGLVEMTRQNVTDGPREILTNTCPTCHGDGIVVSDESRAVDAEYAIRERAARSRAEALLIELPTSVGRLLIGSAGRRLADLERETGKHIALETSDDVAPEHLKFLAEGRASAIEPRGLPVRRGDELTLTLEERHTNGDGDAIARLDGYVVTVAGAARQVGSTVRVRVDRATRTTAHASLADGSGDDATDAVGPGDEFDVLDELVLEDLVEEKP